MDILNSHIDYMKIPVSLHKYQDSHSNSTPSCSHQFTFPLISNSPIFSYEQAFKPIISGNLFKKTLNSQWNSRYFQLSCLRLLYYQDEKKLQLKGSFNLISLMEHRLTIICQIPTITFRVSSFGEDKNLLTLSISNHSEYLSWTHALYYLGNWLTSLQLANPFLSQEYPKIEPIVLWESHHKLIGNINQNFWNKLTISYKQLISYSGHLDILFLRSRNPLSYLQRFLMRSHFDHVALLFKNELQQVYIFESLNQKGVCITNMDNIITTLAQDYEEVGYRKLINHNKDSQISLNILERYLNSLIGKKYQLSLSKLLLGNQNQTKQEQQEGQEKATFFCSQLVADLYLKFGILTSGKSNHYWPKDFQQIKIELAQGYSLSPMITVQFPSYSHQSSETQN